MLYFVNRDGERLTKTWFQLFIDEIATSIGIQKITHITPSGKDYHLVILKALREAGERHCDLAGADSDITACGAQHSAIVKEKHYKKNRMGRSSGTGKEVSPCILRLVSHYWFIGTFIFKIIFQM